VTLREELLEALTEWNVLPPDGIDEHAPLISSGLLDSVALFNLLLWIEERVGQPVDPTTLDIAREWDTVETIIAFVERARAGEASRPVHVAASTPVRVPGRRASAIPEGYEIVRWGTDDPGPILELQKRLWSTDTELNLRFFRWRYVENPADGEPLIYLALKDGKPVGTRSAFPSRWEDASGGSHIWYMSDDLVVMPEHESKGLFAGFSEAMRSDLAARGHRFFLSLSALRVTRLQSLAAGARSLGSMLPVARRTVTIRVMDAARDLAARMPFLWRLSHLRAGFENASRAFTRLDAWKSRRSGPSRLVVSREPRPAEMADLIRRIGPTGGFRMVRDERYFDWRYRNPLHEYRFLFLEEDGQLSGYLVLERSVSDLANQRRVHIADWEAVTPLACSQLLGAALALGRFPELVSWTQTLGEARQNSLREHGFRDIDLEQRARGLPSVLVWPVREDASDDDLRAGERSLLDIGHWDVRMVYTSYA